MASDFEDDQASLTAPILAKSAATAMPDGNNSASIPKGDSDTQGIKPANQVDNETIGLVVKETNGSTKKKNKEQSCGTWLFSMLRASNSPNLVHEIEEPPDWFTYLQELRMLRKNQQYIAMALFVLQAVTLVVVNHGFGSTTLVKHTLTTNSSTEFQGDWVSRLDESTAYYSAMNALTGMLVGGYFFEITTLMFFSAWPDKDNWFNIFGYFYQTSDHQVVRSRLRGITTGFQLRNIYRLAVLIFAMNMALSCGFACGSGEAHTKTSLLGSFSQGNQWLSFSIYTSIRLMDLMTVLPYAEEFWQGIFRSTTSIFRAFVPLLIFLWFFAVMSQILFGMDPFIYPYTGAKITFNHEYPQGGKTVTKSITKLVKDFPESKATAGLEFTRDWFSTGPKAFVSMFQLYTQDGWASDIVRPTMKLADANTADEMLNSFTVFLLFFVYLFLAGVVIANFFTGIVVNAVEQGAKEAEKEMSKDGKIGDSESDSEDGAAHRRVEVAFHAQAKDELRVVNQEVRGIQEQVDLARTEVVAIKQAFLEELSSMRETQAQTQKLITQLLEKSQLPAQQ